MVHDVLNKHSRFHGYKIQHVQQCLVEDYVTHQESACLISQDMYEDYNHLICLVSSDEAVFHVTGVCE
jgi:hypothetical protein